MSTHETQTEQCCPPFDPIPWNEKSHEWKDKLFIRDTVPQFLHIPFQRKLAKVIGKMWKQAQDASAAPEMNDFLLLAYDPSPWKSELYLNVTHEIPGAENIKITGSFLTKVFDGPYNKVPQYIREMNLYAGQAGKKVKKYYFYYTTCPKCAKKYGHNYIVAFAEV